MGDVDEQDRILLAVLFNGKKDYIFKLVKNAHSRRIFLFAV